jgi:hypothetical protein
MHLTSSYEPELYMGYPAVLALLSNPIWESKASSLDNPLDVTADADLSDVSAALQSGGQGTLRQSQRGRRMKDDACCTA